MSKRAMRLAIDGVAQVEETRLARRRTGSARNSGASPSGPHSVAIVRLSFSLNSGNSSGTCRPPCRNELAIGRLPKAVRRSRGLGAIPVSIAPTGLTGGTSDYVERMVLQHPYPRFTSINSLSENLFAEFLTFGSEP